MKPQDLANLALFKGIDNKLFNHLISGGSFEAFTKNEMAYEEGEKAARFGIIASGLFRMTKDDTLGSRVALLFLSSGDLVGDLPMALNEPRYAMNCETLVSGIIFWIPKETYTRYWLTSPPAMQRVQAATLDRLQWMAQCRADQRLPLGSRVAGFLIRAQSRKDDNPESAIMTLTRRALADAVGASVESVIRVMASWEKRGLVATPEKVVTIRDIAAVQEIHEKPKKRNRKRRSFRS
ncbi:MAG: Crp/Fnr family transcriptional regulator [Pseudobdellovibrionaceae bacterium]